MTATLRYPIGIQTFSNIIEGGYAYVDKTAFITDLLRHGKYLFLSRPRRFGKSLMVSTLEAFFEGRRDLFKGLAIDSADLDWTPSPVLHFDFNSENFTLENGLEYLMDSLLGSFERTYGCAAEVTTPSQRFRHLIQVAYEQTGMPVVILIDEYDKPLLAVEQNKKLLEKNQAILKSFFGNLKSMDRYIRFAFITGVARFSKVSIFSDLNNLDDISMEDTFADICGWTEEELLETFQTGITELAEKRKDTFDTTVKLLRNYYDGYKFAETGSHLYNPFSVLRALKAKDVSPYWFATGSPNFLVKRVRKRGVFPADLNGQMCDKDELIAVGLDDRNPVPLMFQTGYLTIDSYDEEMGVYTLRFPNREVEIGFYKDLLPMYAPATDESDGPFSFTQFKQDIFSGRPEDFMKRLAALLKDLPGEDHSESVYRAVTYLLTVLCTPRTLAEHHGYKGRSDIEVVTSRFVYIFEFKYNKSVSEAMKQIHSRDYAGRYVMETRPVFLIAANFNENKGKRGLEYEIREFGR
ncbi:MAG: ATP-binding protein [Muribaculaceae bacterium]|nr:ATP-binding protein [Muribaculaceae bacterium]